MQYLMQKIYFFFKIFGYFKKKSYLCTLNCELVNKQSFSNMKKGLFILSLLCLSVCLMAQNAEQKDQKQKGAHPYKVAENENASPEFSHWSLTPHVGFNYFDGDFGWEMTHAIHYPNAGLDLEYSFNPVWGLGLTYMFDRYGVTGRPGQDNADTLLNGYMHKAGLYVSMDFVNLFYPKAKKKIVSVEAVIGGGYAWYKRNLYYPDSTRFHSASYPASGPDTKYFGELFLQAGLNVEFNLNRTMALGVRATYSYFINDYVDGRGFQGLESLASKNNDGMVDVTLNMRFKLMGVSKTHVRNIASCEWLEESKNKNDKDKGNKNSGDGPCCHDTIYIQHDSIIVREVRELRHSTTVKESDKNVYYVYFDKGKSGLTNNGLITIQQVADRLVEDPSLYAVVTGYCDNTGSNRFNYALGDTRANNVIDELREEHGISDDHMYSTGLGKLVGRRSGGAYGPNRRAAIRLVDKATFDRLKADLEAKRAQRSDNDPAMEHATLPHHGQQAQDQQPQVQPQTRRSDVQTVPLSESARPEKINEYKQRAGETVTTEKSTTLSKLARQYYNNTYCWVYIYIANKDKIKNPNALTPGLQLSIPELTQQEMRITKDQSLVLYGNARQGK